MSIVQTYNSFHIGSESGLTELQMDQLTECFKRPLISTRSVLGGRNAFSIIELHGSGRVVIKNYSRGGLIRYFNRRTYIKLGQSRCESEYELLRYIKKVNISSLDPVAFVFKGTFFYNAWLVTKEIQQAQSLAEISLKDLDSAQIAMKALKQQIEVMLENRIFHVDLHPGNVLIDRTGKIYIIDFDKARINVENTMQLRKMYISRWRRAVLKHHLPTILNDLMNI